MGHDVFVSHSSADKAVADAVVAVLESNGVRCWVAPRDILPGASWANSILKAIADCKLMVLVFSADTNSSHHIRREVERAIHRGIAIAPVRIHDVLPADELEYFLSSSHWMDAITPPLENHLSDLARKVRSLLGLPELPERRPATSPPPVLPAAGPPAAASAVAAVPNGDVQAPPRPVWHYAAAIAAVAVITLILALGFGHDQRSERDTVPTDLAVSGNAGAEAPANGTGAMRSDVSSPVVLVVPNTLARQEGTHGANVPWIGTRAIRNQQVFSSAEFTSAGGALSITQIALRPDDSLAQATNVSSPFLQVRLSTTSKAPDGLSLTFADNIGPDQTLVFSGPLAVSTMNRGAASGPKGFDVLINFERPFLYDPVKGNLLIEVTKTQGATPSPVFFLVDAHSASGDGVSSVNYDDFNDDAASAAIAQNAFTVGYVARFTYTVFPKDASNGVIPALSQPPNVPARSESRKGDIHMIPAPAELRQEIGRGPVG